VREYADTQRVPAEVLAEERPRLQPLPAPYRGNVRAARARPIAAAPVNLP